MKRVRFISTFLIVAMVCIVPVSHVSLQQADAAHAFPSFESTPSKAQLDKAASYLLSMYNPTLGLVANSEDEGPNPYGDGVPCNRTYWVYSDNLFAGWALQPFDENIADNITGTVERYVAMYGRSLLFEAAIGEPIPTTIHAKKNVKVFDGVVNGVRVQVLLDRHQYADNPSVFHDADEYADLCFYLAINYWMTNDTSASIHWFRTGERMWNYTTDKGFYDKAARNEGLYQNYKLGLFLLAQVVTRLDSNITTHVEATAWGYQQDNGGITSLSWLDGSLYGTANAEATSALLLAYNEGLINRLHNRQSYYEYTLEKTFEKIEELEDEIRLLKDSPWAADPWPIWFTFLISSTVVLTIMTSALAIYLKRLGSNVKRR